MLLVEPVVIRPLLAEWNAEKTRDRRRAGTCRSRQVAPRSHETVERGRASVPGVPQPGCADSQCSTRRAARGNFLYLALKALKDLEHRVQLEAEALGHPAGVSGDRPGQRQGHRDQPLRGGTGARVGLDRRDPVDAAQRLRGSARPDPEAARHHRVPGRNPDAGQPLA